MFFYAKVQFACVVLIVFAIALLAPDSRLPYWPIEVSRAAESGGIWSNRVFLVGTLSLVVTMTWETFWVHWNQMEHPLDTPLLFAPALIVVAWMADRPHMIIHNAAVAVVCAVVTAHTLVSAEWRHRIVALAAAATLMITSASLKAAAALYVEIDQHPLEWRVPAWLLTNHSGITMRVARKVLHIMWEGDATCLAPQYTLPIFRITGTLQWSAFYLLSTVY